jgi:putative transposase
MARLARVVIPGLSHHVTQRGNGRQRVFFNDGDYALYRDLLSASCKKAHVACWAWVAMPNHVHLILVPRDEDGLRAALASVHRQYAGLIHARRKRTGHFWQGRFGAVVMDEAHLAEAFRYVLLNPVRARLAKRPEQWRWSSARAYLKGANDGLTDTGPMLSRFPDMGALLMAETDEDAQQRLRAAETIGRPIGNASFLKKIEKQLGRNLAPQKRGPKPEEN